MIVIVYCLLITAVLIYVLVSTEKERKRLIELLAAKDYADYKNFEGAEKPVLRRDKNNMFQKRNKEQQNRFIETE